MKITMRLKPSDDGGVVAEALDRKLEGAQAEVVALDPQGGAELGQLLPDIVAARSSLSFELDEPGRAGPGAGPRSG